MFEYTVRMFCLLCIITIVSAFRDPDFHRGQQVQSVHSYYDQPFHKHHHHKHHYDEALLHYFAWGTVATLVIIKILLAISLSGMVYGIIHLFVGIKYLLREKVVTPVAPPPQPVIVPHYHHDPHSHEYYSHESPYAAHDHYQRRKQVFTGGRTLERNEPEEGYSPNEIKQRRRRNLKTLLNADMKPTPQKRIVRSAEEEVKPNNCKMRAACQFHAKAKLSPFYTFQLFFISKDGLAQYWDHKDRKFDECATVYPCSSNGQSKIVEEKHVDSKDTALPSITKVTEQRRRQFNSDSGSYSAEYETQFSQPSGSALTYDYSGSY